MSDLMVRESKIRKWFSGSHKTKGQDLARAQIFRMSNIMSNPALEEHPPPADVDEAGEVALGSRQHRWRLGASGNRDDEKNSERAEGGARK